MNRPRGGSLVGGILLCHLVGAMALFLYCFLNAPPDLVAAYTVLYPLTNALVLLIAEMPAFTAAGAMIAYSLLAGRQTRPAVREPVSAEAVVRPAIVAFLVFALANAALTGLLSPGLWRRLIDMETSSLLAKGYREEMAAAVERAEKSASSADYAAAADAAVRYLEIDAGNADIARLGVRYEELAQEARRVEEARRPAGEAAAPVEIVRDAVGLLRRAESFYAAGDYYSAHYYASLAQRSPEVRVRAAELVVAAERQISPRTPLSSKTTAEERAAAERSQQKRDAYALYERGDWVAAYYRFGELAVQYPDDTDIGNYHRLAREKVMETAFPVEEAREALRLPGVEGIVFTVDGERAAPGVVSIRKMVRAPNGVYFADIETMRADAVAGVTFHLFARYGKLEGSAIILAAVDETERWRSEEPVVYVNAERAAITVALDPGFDPDALGYLSADPRSLRAVPAGILWGMRSWARRGGVLQAALDLEVLLFVARAALYVVLCVVALALSLRFPARYYGRRSAAALLGFVVFPFAAAGAWSLADDATRLVCGALLAAAGFVATAVAAAVALVALAALSLVMLARSTVEVP